jgi:hypothetical protein
MTVARLVAPLAAVVLVAGLRLRFGITRERLVDDLRCCIHSGHDCGSRPFAVMCGRSAVATHGGGADLTRR